MEGIKEYLENSKLNTIPKKDLIDKGDYFETIGFKIYNRSLVEKACEIVKQQTKKEVIEEVKNIIAKLSKNTHKICTVEGNYKNGFTCAINEIKYKLKQLED